MHDDTPPPACIICWRTLYADEHARYTCRLCEQRGVTMLRAIPDMYEQLGDLLPPGTTAGDERSSSGKSAPMPCSAEVLNLRAPGGIVTILATWEDAVREELSFPRATFRGNLEQTLAGVIQFLIANAPWIYGAFEAADEFHRELQRLHGQARAYTEGGQTPRRVPVQCACGQVLRVTLDTAGVRCPSCETQYGHTELFELPLAERRAA